MIPYKQVNTAGDIFRFVKLFLISYLSFPSSVSFTKHQQIIEAKWHYAAAWNAVHAFAAEMHDENELTMRD